ncbi:circadian clock protein KaiC [Brasilonema octagenarum UFV-E1]|uniref:non-specific serine/threonine protein kinase n=1 Tax=Brasilonema sennae CENA114 TaxID=415709 RepID=A0A856MHE9_9CYAN|nr:circadian clock protein KaiC [Brasilonema sennae]QDL10012.1 circadian clock protein KaiC [Brasilonema sennae CENA114]QDL16365.1 circadian clock protein KaiC [Brasilonema octagenarum UFV-E1]
MNQEKEQDLVEKLITGIPGFDILSEGGLPKSRVTLVVGTAGSGKTVFASQYLAQGIERGENGVFVTFEETPQRIRKNMRGFGWDIRKWEEEGKWAFVDASRQPGEKPLVSGEYDFDSLVARIKYAINQVGAARVSMDCLGAMFTYLPDKAQVRNDLFMIGSVLEQIESTVVVTSERNQEYGDISTYGVEEFVADNVIILRNVIFQQKRRRTIEILKYRGSSHKQGEFPFSIVADRGIVIIPLSRTETTEESTTDIRITSGVPELDGMCDGGFFKNSIILVSGATGTGKTLVSTQFIAAGVNNNERCLLFAFEENRELILRNALGWSVDFRQMERDGQLKFVCRNPEAHPLEYHLIKMQEMIEEFQPHRVAIDSLSALEWASNTEGFRQFLVGLNSMIRERKMTALYTSTTPMSLVSSTSTSENHISITTDVIILLRYVEIYGEIRRGIAVIKMRGSQHDKQIREFTIDNRGMHIGKPFRNITGILIGNPISGFYKPK